MKTRVVLSAIAGLILTTLTSQAAINVIGSAVVNPSNGYFYEVLSPGSWIDSEAFAVSLGGHLASVHNSADDLWLLSTFSPIATSYSGISSPNMWIGFYDPVSGDGSGATHASHFIWSDGSAVDFTAWFSGEPNNTGNSEYYAQLRGQSSTPLGTWNDIPNGSSPNFGIVEIVPEPQAYGFLLVGGVVFAVFRKKRVVTA